jgi:outer membrane biosynthesis protein TonB
MKTLNIKSLAVIVSLLSVSMFTMARGLEPVQDTKQIITEKIEYPSFAIEKQIEGTVEVFFIIDSDGKIVIDQISSTNSELKDYVKQKIEKIRLTENLNDPKLKYSIKLNFDLK